GPDSPGIVNFQMTERITGTVSATYSDPVTTDGVPVGAIETALIPLDPTGERSGIHYTGNGHGINNDVPVGHYHALLTFKTSQGEAERYAWDYVRDPQALESGVGLDPTGALIV